MGQLESDFQTKVKQALEYMFPGAIVLKNDPNLQQGIPDLVILWRSRWAFLECKRSAHEEEQPNQRYFVEYAQSWTFGAFIYPENAEETLHALQQAFRARR